MAGTAEKDRFSNYLTVRDAAAVLGVSPWTLRNWDNSGKLKSSRHPVSGYRMYRREDLENLLKSGAYSQKNNQTMNLHADWSEFDERDHFVQFYENDGTLVDSVSAYVARALDGGESAIIIATPSHRNRIHRKLQRIGADVTGARERDQYVVLDAADTLSKFMNGSAPDRVRFQEVVGETVGQMTRRWPKVRAFGEMVAVLWEEGNRDAAFELEALWNDLAKTNPFMLFCAYPIDCFDDEPGKSILDVCKCHSRVIPAESFTALSNSDEQFRQIAVLQQKAEQLELEIQRRRQTERELSDFVENAVEGLHKVGPDGTILWANNAELAMLGYSADEYIGRHIGDFYVDRSEIEGILQQLLKGEEVLNRPAQLRCRDGSIKDVLIHSNGCFENGKFVYSRCFTRDITELKAAECDRLRLASIVECSQDAIISKTLDGVIRSWNAGATRIFGYTEAEVVGQNITVLIPKDRIQEEKDIIARLSRGERIEHYETVRVAKDGTQLDVSLTISPLRDASGKIIGASKIARDITERKRAEQQLKESDRRKDEFIATLAHELRNPLAPIRNSLHILRMSNSDGKVAKVHEIMERQVAHMVRLIDDLLELSRINRGKIELKKERLELKTVIDQAVESSQPFINAAGHSLNVSLPADPVIVEADNVRLSQVFSNLLNNAAKFTNKGGAISISANCEKGEVAVSVTDNGIGIPRDMLPRVFDMFVQIKNPLRRSQDGLGIGLNLVKTIVGMHAGRVEARSEGLGLGSTFVIRLPICNSESSTRKNAPPRNENEKGQPVCRILIVDDHRDSADSLAMMLQLFGADVQIAYDGASAIERFNIWRPAVVLMDLGMPGMDGYETARRIRKVDRNVVLIALTGWGQQEDRRRSREAGFDHHLVKPVDFDVLQGLLASCPIRVAV